MISIGYEKQTLQQGYFSDLRWKSELLISLVLSFDNRHKNVLILGRIGAC